MAKRRVLALAATTVLALGAAPAAYAADGDGSTAAITATVTAGAIGSRSVTLVSPVTMTSVLNSSSLTAAMSVEVTEAARTGTNPWSVTASSSSLSDGTNTLSAANLAVSGRGSTKVAGGGTLSAPTGSQTLDSARTLFSDSGQSTSTVYTGVYTGTSTITLTVPNATVAGVYSGTMTVTLVQ